MSESELRYSPSDRLADRETILLELASPSLLVEKSVSLKFY